MDKYCPCEKIFHFLRHLDATVHGSESSIWNASNTDVDLWYYQTYLIDVGARGQQARPG
jgi:hypothetical protein